jgi:hypothetical protein
MLKPTDFVIKQMAQSYGMSRGNAKMTYSVNPIDDAKVKEGLAAQHERIRKTIQEMEASRKY